MCVYICVCACKTKYMHIHVCAYVCVTYKTFLRFIRPSLLLPLAVETISILWERCAPSLSSLGLLVLRPHSPRLLFALRVCVCACPMQRRLPLPTQQRAWGCTSDAGFKEGTGKLPNSLAKWTTTLKEVCEPGSSLFPSSPVAAASHDCSLARTQSA